MECIICCEEITNINEVFTKNSDISQSSGGRNNIYHYCYNCVLNIKKTKIPRFIEYFKQEDCLASIRRMIKNGIPYTVDEKGIEIYREGVDISYILTYENIEKIKSINNQLLEIINLDDDVIKETAIQIINQLEL